MARTRKKPNDPVQVETEGVKVTVETERAAPQAPAPEPNEAKTDKTTKRPRSRKPPAKNNGRAAAPAPAVEPVPVPVPIPVPVPAEPLPVPGMANLLNDAENLRHQLGDAGRQAEETRLLLQTVRHQHEGLTREVESLRQEAGAVTQETARQAEEVRGQVESLKQSHEEANREIAGLRQHAGAARADLQETLKGAAAVRTELESAAQRLGEAERLFRETAQQLVNELRGQIGPVRQILQEAAPHLEAFPAQSAQVLERLEQTARTLPEALRQRQRLEQESQDAERRLTGLREQTALEEARLESLRQQTREAEGRLGSLRQQTVEAEARPQEVRNAPAGEAAPSAAAEAFAEASRPRLGLTVGPGVVVDEVMTGSAAAAAGLAIGDVIQAVNGIQVTDGAEVRSLIQGVQGGENVVLTVSRAGEAVDLSVTLVDPSGQEPAEEGRPYLGLTVHPGVVVAEVQPGSPAEAAGLARGDVIQAANGTPILAGEQIRQAMLWEQLRRAVQAEQLGAQAAAETELSLEVSRSGQVREVKVPLPLSQPPLSA